MVSSGLEKPYYIKNMGMSPSGCYTRIGTSSQPMTTALIDDLYARRIHTTLRNITAPRQDLKFAQLKIFRISDHFIKVIFPFDEELLDINIKNTINTATDATDATNTATDATNQLIELTEDEKKVVSAISVNPEITRLAY